MTETSLFERNESNELAPFPFVFLLGSQLARLLLRLREWRLT